jgi:hypothetical protein
VTEAVLLDGEEGLDTFFSEVLESLGWYLGKIAERAFISLA